MFQVIDPGSKSKCSRISRILVEFPCCFAFWAEYPRFRATQSTPSMAIFLVNSNISLGDTDGYAKKKGRLVAGLVMEEKVLKFGVV